MKIQEGYDKVAETYALTFFDELDHKPLDRYLFQLFAQRLRTGARVCDLGCGPGHVARYVKDLGVDVFGIDISEQMLAEARKRNPDIEFVYGDMLDLKFEKASLGGIVLFYAIVHFKIEVIRQLASDLWEALEEGGLIFLAFHAGDEIMHVDSLLDHEVDMDYVFLDADLVAAAFRDAGFNLVESFVRQHVADHEFPSKRGYIICEKRLNSDQMPHVADNHQLSKEEVIALLEQNYKLSHPIECTFLRRSYNDHYLAASADGHFIVRIYINNKYHIASPADFSFELELLMHLWAMNFPVAYPLKNVDHQLISGYNHGTHTRHCVLFSYAPGVPIETSLTDDISQQFGVTIAKLHLAVDSFSSKHSRYTVDLDYLITQPLSYLSEQSDKYNLGSLGFFKPYADNLQVALSRLLDESSASHSPIWGIIHGDLNPSNIHMDPVKGLTLFDFDHCGYGFRIHDLAVVQLCFEKETYTTFLDAYCTTRALTTIEKACIPLYAEALLIRKYMDVLSMQHTFKPSEFDEAAYVASAISFLRTLVD